MTIQPVDIQPLSAEAQQELAQRCREILTWQRTGVLPGEALRALAEKKWPDDHDSLQLAEAQTTRDALKAVIAAADAGHTAPAPVPALANVERLAKVQDDQELAQYWRVQVAGLLEEAVPDDVARYLADRVIELVYDVKRAGEPRPASLDIDPHATYDQRQPE